MKQLKTYHFDFPSKVRKKRKNNNNITTNVLANIMKTAYGFVHLTNIFKKKEKSEAFENCFGYTLSDHI